MSAPPSSVAASARAGLRAGLLAGWRPGDFLMEREGHGVLGQGVAGRIEVPAMPAQAVRAALMAEEALASATGEAGIVAGALPFRGDIPALLVIPERVLTDPERPAAVPEAVGTGHERPIAPPRGPGAPAHAAGQDPDGPRPLRWRPEPSAAAFREAVEEAIRRIQEGELEKVVLRRSLVAGNPGVDLGLLLAELRREDPGCHLFAAPAAAGGTLVGATPETLIRRRGQAVLSVPHAGTAARSADPARDRWLAAQLLRSEKDRHEHRVVVEEVADRLAPHCEQLEVDPEPHLTATGAVWHLATTLRGRLRHSAPSSLALAAALHPTPAVCGRPARSALELIAQLEPAGRGLYSGLVGWMDSRGDGEWAVSLRCALVTDDEVRLDAGVGLVAESDPDAEVAETEAKFVTLLEALGATGIGSA